MSDEWIEWQGGECPVVGEVEIRLRNGDTLKGEAEPYTWEHNATERGSWRDYEIVAYRLINGAHITRASASVISDGGSSDYYKLTIKNKTGETLSCEMGDIIRHVFGNDFDLGNVVKAARRMYLASQGTGKDGTSIGYDANKVVYFINEFRHWNENENVP
jgi:DNA-binding Xre family transcriptional regulator